jgi:hypothetical protein
LVLKNSCQSALIWADAAELVPPEEGVPEPWPPDGALPPEEAVVAADGGDAGRAEAAPGVPELAVVPALALELGLELGLAPWLAPGGRLPLLLQAATLTAGSRADAAMEITLMGCSRIGALPVTRPPDRGVVGRYRAGWRSGS